MGPPPLGASHCMTDPPSAPPSFNDLRVGDRMPAIRQRTGGNPRGFHPEVLAGRYIVFCAYITTADPLGKSAVAAIARRRDRFDDVFASVFGIGVDPGDEDRAAFADQPPGVRAMWDIDTTVCRQLGVLPLQASAPGQPSPARRSWIVVDPTLHVLALIPFQADDPEHERVFELLDRLPPPAAFGGIAIPPPVLVLPNVLEPALCGQLIGLYDADGGQESGVVRDHASILDGGFKRRRDYTITDPAVIQALKDRLARRVLPEISRLFFMEANFIERQIIGCYAAEDGGHFSPHRDNNPGLTAHRRYAVSINLNDGFEGGEVHFPEYSAAGLKAPAGWAVVFPCAILHAVAPVRTGRRYAYLPFVFDRVGLEIRDRQAAAAAP